MTGLACFLLLLGQAAATQVAAGQKVEERVEQGREQDAVKLPARENFHLFVLAGQSNMAGRGAVHEADLKTSPRVLMLNKELQWVEAVDPLHFDKPKIAGVGLGKTFALQYAADHPGVTVGLVPCAVGGSAIETWLPGGFHQQTKSHPYDDALARCKHAAEAGTIRGILWHQGESDSTPVRSKEYLGRLRQVAENFRNELGQELPWLLGGLGQFRDVPWKDGRKVVDQAHRQFAASQTLTYFVPSDGLVHKGDRTHFSAASAREFGRRYYDVWRFHEMSRSRLELPPSNDNPRNSEGDFITLADGKILFVYSKFSGGPSDHAAADLVSRFSSDGGMTWSDQDALVLANEGDMNTMSVSLLRLQDGRIAMFYLRKNSLTDCCPVLRVSSDEAASWGPPVEIVSDEMTGYYIVNNDRVVQLSSGRIIVPIALHSTPKEPRPDWAGRVGCFFSDDGGQSWDRSEKLLTTEVDGKRIMTQEPGVFELGDGSLLMWVRTDAGFQYQSVSHDSGLTWTAFERMQLPSPRSPASIERIPQTGDLLAVWNDHKFVPIKERSLRTPLSYSISSDDGKTWSESVPLMTDPDGWYCYTAIHFDSDHLLLGTCAGRNAAGQHLATTAIKRLPLDALYQRLVTSRIESHRRIWSGAAHNAFTDLCGHDGKWYCVFREGGGHVSPEGKLRVLRTEDIDDPEANWESVALIESNSGDLRDAKLTVTPKGRLMLSGAVALPKGAEYRHQSLAWFSEDGQSWSDEVEIGPRNYWLWRTTWHDEVAYSVGYHTGASGGRHVRLFKSRDGEHFETLVPRLFDQGYANETSLLFEGQTAYCLLRRDGSEPTAQLGVANAPFESWQWTDLGVRIGGPHMIRVPDGRVFAAGRLYTSNGLDGKALSDVRTSLCQLNLVTGQVTEVLRLPSGGDTSYPGLVYHNDHLWISYYSSHEAGQIQENPECKSAIYLAKIKLP